MFRRRVDLPFSFCNFMVLKIPFFVNKSPLLLRIIKIFRKKEQGLQMQALLLIMDYFS